MSDPKIPSESQIARTMTLVYLFAAAVKDATPDQRAQLAQAKDLLREPAGTPGASMGDVAQRVVDIMGHDWMPADEWLAAIEAMTGKKLR